MLQIGAEWQTEVPGGINRYTHGIAGAMADQGAVQHWLVVGDHPTAPWRNCDITAAAASGTWLPRRLLAIRQAAGRLASGCDVATSHFALYAAAALGQLGGLPHIVHFHGPWSEESAVEGGNRAAVWAKHQVERRVYHSAIRCITLSQAFADVLARSYGVDERRIRVIPGGICPDEWDPPIDATGARHQLGWPTDRPIILCVRRLARRMGIDLLVEAVVELRRRHPEVLVIVGGKGPMHVPLQTQIESRGIEGNMRLAGFIPNGDLPLAYRAADLTIVPTQSLEGFGLVVLESLAAGTPALVTPIGGLPEVVNDLNDKLILENATVAAIVDGLGSALAGTATLPTATECQNYVRSRFAWADIAHRVLDIYREAQQSK
jgi:glycosyltransferase involved in cell wall biosynthesis